MTGRTSIRAESLHVFRVGSTADQGCSKWRITSLLVLMVGTRKGPALEPAFQGCKVHLLSCVSVADSQSC